MQIVTLLNTINLYEPLRLFNSHLLKFRRKYALLPEIRSVEPIRDFSQYFANRLFMADTGRY